MGKPKINRAEKAKREAQLQQVFRGVEGRADEYRNEGAASALRILRAHGQQYVGAILILTTEYARRGWEVA